MTQKIQEAATLQEKIAQAAKEATPLPYYYDSGNGEIESHHPDHWRCAVADRADLSNRLDHFKHFDLKIDPPEFPRHPDSDMEFLCLAANSVLELCDYIQSANAKITKLTEALKHIADGNYQITDYGRNYLEHNVVEELYSDKELKLWAQEVLKSCEQYDEQTLENV